VVTGHMQSEAVVFIAVAAGVWDLRTRRIPNALTFGAAAGACLLALMDGGLSGLGRSAAGLFIALVIFLPVYALGGMGAGDVKLLAALGAWLGARDASRMALYTALAGGLLGVIVTISRGYFISALRNIAALFGFWFRFGIRPHPDFTIHSGSSPKLAYAIPIGIGAVTALWLR
jgi:prepilin peptidase CpaA